MYVCVHCFTEHTTSSSISCVGAPLHKITANERALGQVSILNHGQYRFEYHWVLLEKKGEREQWQLGITPMAGAVEPYDHACSELSFSPMTKAVLRGCELVLEVRRTPLK